MSLVWIPAVVMAIVWGNIAGHEARKRKWPFFPHCVALALIPVAVMDTIIIVFFGG
jgi:hypothetical protein